ncbi:ornithine carbamoyltransferase [Sporolactobacillus shoreae]|uniref:Ornithine carbamoyltransferase n=1 Tax=Sporolactobacillus shoreae TaxID=1465501 RepID=A0A4Z0GHG4_9BACL|nr:ornithine carbamoyltransferase [Sporolactobacillus shoreae]TGA95931.1 ornithine carbamoyltransferase [Sporolactobacillus shoreae]
MNILRIADLTNDQIDEIFDLADNIKNRNTNVPSLDGKTFILFFPESSIRTRITFEKGIMDMGGRSIIFPPEALNKKERLEDVIKYIENWADGVIVRHTDISTIIELSKYASIPIINAMTSENHPCEILTDLYTITRKKLNYKELVYTFVGPASNISRTWMEIAKVMDLNFIQVCKRGFELGKDTQNYIFQTELQSVLPVSDVILTDSLPRSLKTEEYIKKYQITLERMRLTKPMSLLNPCPPFFRNEEVSDDAVSSEYFVGYDFKKNLIFVQQAIILYCLTH